jgi:long-chain acyl-CoA synthetase
MREKVYQMVGNPSITQIKEQTIVPLFLKTAETYPHNIAFHYFRGGWKSNTYRDFAADVLSIASFLMQSGIRKDDRIAIISENRPEWCAAYLAILGAGGIAVPIDAQLSADEVQNLLSDAEAGAVFHSSRTADQLSAYMKKSAKVSGTTVTLIDFDSPEFDSKRHSSSVSAFRACDPEDIASIIYTSGTTGKPKGVMLSHQNFCSDADAAIQARIVSHEDTVLSILPLHHTYAFMCSFLIPLFLGGSIVYPQSMKGPDMLAAMQAADVSILVGVPQLLGLLRDGIINKMKAQPRPVSFLAALLLRLSGFMRKRFGISIGKLVFGSVHRAFGPRFRFFTSGGARLDPSIMLDLEALGFAVLEGYGLTETSPIVTFNPVEERKPGSAGKPLPSVEIRISNPSENGEGEVEIRGPMVMKGYYKNPSATDDVLRNGWLRTGDIGMMDKDGYLFITGRSKEVIVLSSGKNIYPEDVEKMYHGSRLIKEICVTGTGHRGITDSLHAVIVPDFEHMKQAGISNLHEAIKWEINDISGRLPSYMRITGFSLQKEPLPRTPLGKLRRFMITADQGQAAVKKKTPVIEPADILQRNVLDTVREFAKGDQEIHPGDNLELDLGLDSLSKIELIVSLEKNFSLNLPENFMADIHTVNELIEKVRLLSTAPLTEQAEKIGWKEIISAEPEKKIVLEKPESLMLPSRIIYAGLKLLMKLFFRLDAKGRENVSSSGSFIIAPNHISYLDGFVVVLALPFARFKNLYLLGISDFFTGFLKSSFAKIAHVIPIDSASYLNRALQTSAYVLRHGRSLCVFPEGGRSADGNLLEFKKGVGILAVEMGVPVVPAYIEGAFEALPRGAAWPKPAKITVTFGTPLSASDLDFTKKPDDMDDYQYFVSVLREKVRDLSGSA